MAKHVSEVFVDTLIKAGIRRVYGVVGDSLNGITDVIRQRPEIQWQHVRHEETAAFAAGAEAHLTGRITCCAGSCGPGNLHLINGLYDCYRSRVPVLAIAAQIPSKEIGTGYFQETNPEHLFKECSHYCGTISSPEQMPRILAIAIRTAIAKRGPAVVIISGDVALKKCEAEAIDIGLDLEPSTSIPSAKGLAEAAQILNNADSITILGGAGCQGAHAELMALAEKLKSPIVHALRGKESIEYDNPFDVGMSGLLGTSAGYHALKNCNALLMLGTDFPYTQFLPTQAKVIQVDLRGEQIGKRVKVDLGLVGSVKDTIEKLLPLLATHQETDHLNACRKEYAHNLHSLDELAVGIPGHRPIHPQHLARTISDEAATDAIFTCDVGTPTVWAARYLRMNGRRRLIGSFSHGSMASAMPQAIGAQCTFPDRQVIALCGDGGLSMLLGDLITIKQLNLPVKIVVFNNSSLGFVELEMKVGGFLEFGTDLENPNFARLADSMGILGLHCDDPSELLSTVRTALDHDGPCLIDVKVNRQELSMPPTITAEQAMGFSLYALKAVVSGRGEELIDLAKANLSR